MEKQTQFISILSDYGFKVTFANEENTLFLRKALKALIQSPHEIKEIQFLKNEASGITQIARGGRFDLLCKDEKENSFIVEMQLGPYQHFMQRAKFYAFHRFNTLVKKGKEFIFEGLTPIYCIGILAHNIFPNSEQYYHFATLKNQIGEELDRQIVHVIVEIRKFDKNPDELVTDLDKLIYFMKNTEQIQNSTEMPQVITEEWLSQAIDKLNKSAMTPEERMHHEIALAGAASDLWVRKKEIKEAVEEAVQEAVQKTTKETQRETAKKLKDNGVAHEIIHESTGLSMEEIEQL